MTKKRNVAIYVRVSTENQTYDQQIDPCKNFCKMKGWDEITIFKEIASTRRQRPIWNDLLFQIRKGVFDTIVVFRLDRAWRSSRKFIMNFDEFQNKGITVVSVMEGLDPTTPIGKAMMTILVALGELERENISQATKQRLQALKNQGKKLGRPKGSKDSKKRKTAGYKERWQRERQRAKRKRRYYK